VKRILLLIIVTVILGLFWAEAVSMTKAEVQGPAALAQGAFLEMIYHPMNQVTQMAPVALLAQMNPLERFMVRASNVLRLHTVQRSSVMHTLGPITSVLACPTLA
jgi:hypothetical protein